MENGSPCSQQKTGENGPGNGRYAASSPYEQCTQAREENIGCDTHRSMGQIHVLKSVLHRYPSSYELVTEVSIKLVMVTLTSLTTKGRRPPKPLVKVLSVAMASQFCGSALPVGQARAISCEPITRKRRE